nr:GMP synthase [Tanacetum cinerariifolium]
DTTSKYPIYMTHTVLMSHGDEAVMVSNGFEVVARSKQGAVVAVEYGQRWFYGRLHH